MNFTLLSVWNLSLALLALGCDTAQRERSVSSASTPDDSAAPASPRLTPPPPAPADLNLAALLKRLDCPNRLRKGACRVAAGFEKAGALNWKRPAGKARWVGYQYTVEKGAEKRELVILQAREIPTAQAGIGSLALRIGTGGFPEELLAHAERMVSARSRKSGPSPRNLAPRFVSDFDPAKDWSTIQTDGPSILSVEADPAYIR